MTNIITIKNNTIKHRCRYQAGLSLIELMIAMFIGLFLLLSISSVYLSNLKADKSRNQYSLLEDNARLALDTMSQVIQHAGYAGSKAIMTDNPFMTSTIKQNGSDCMVDNDTLFASFNKTKDDDTGTQFTGDRIGVIYLANDPLIAGMATPEEVINYDCAGSVVPNQCQIGNAANMGRDANRSRIFNAFYINNKGQLNCIGSYTKGAQLIADNIENMQISYGVDMDGDPNMSVDQYLDATAVAALPGGWGSVRSVQIAVLVKSDKEIKQTAEQRTYDLLGKKIKAPGGTKKDKFQRAVFSTTVALEE
jgi:type IV pilus assembly protein PilW